MSFGFLLFPEGGQLTAKEIRVSLDYGLIRNKRTKFDRTNLDAFRGDTEIYIFKAYQGQKLVDLTNFEITVTLRKTYKDQEVLFQEVLVDEIGANDFINGAFSFELSNLITRDLPSLCKYDIRGVSLIDSTTETLVAGQLRTQTGASTTYRA